MNCQSVFSVKQKDICCLVILLSVYLELEANWIIETERVLQIRGVFKTSMILVWKPQKG